MNDDNSGNDAEASKELETTKATSPEVTSFQEAAQAKVHEALDPTGERLESIVNQPGTMNASTMVTEVLKALTKNVNDGSSSTESASGAGAQVIDLDAVRRQRKNAATNPLGALIGTAVKDTVQQFIATYAQDKDLTGPVEVDTQFLKDNGQKFLGTLFHSLAGAFQAAAEDGPAQAKPLDSLPTENQVSEDDKPPGDETAINVNVDLGGLITALFQRDKD